MNAKYGDGINPRTKWKNINELLGRNNKKKMIDTITNEDGSLTSDPKVIAKRLNEHFVNQQSSTHASSPTTESRRTSFPSMFLSPITANEILLIIHELKNKKSVGYDNVSTSLVKHCAMTL